MRFMAIKCNFKDSCYSKPEPSLSLLICDIQGQKATTYCASPSSSSSSSAAAAAAAAPVTSVFASALTSLPPPPLPQCTLCHGSPYSLCLSAMQSECTPSIRGHFLCCFPFGNNSHTWPNLPLAFISVCLSWLMLSKNHWGTHAYWTVLKGSFLSDGTCRCGRVEAQVLINVCRLRSNRPS